MAMAAAAAANNDIRYWCHICSQVVNPMSTEAEIKCPRCNSGFIEEMEAEAEAEQQQQQSQAASSSLSLWAPILLGMLSDGLRRGSAAATTNNSSPNSEQEQQEEDDNAMLSLLRTRQRASAILEVLSDLQDRLQLEESNNVPPNREREQAAGMINPIGASLAEHFIGPGLDQLLQHLAENEPNRHGTPPAKKDAVEAMPAVKVDEKTSCYVCLEDFEVGEEAREMPCKHRFHAGCILPWLQAHSSCPVCRYQMPVDEEPKESNIARSGSGGGRNEGNGRRIGMPVLPWPFSGLFSLSLGSSQNNGAAASSSSSSMSATGGNSNDTISDEH